MKRVVLLSHGFQHEYEIAFANGLAKNGVAVTLIGSDSTLVDRKVPGVEFLNLRGSQDPNRPRIVKLFNIVRYVIRYLTYLARTRGTSVHLIGLFSTRSAVFSLFEAWMTRLCAGPYILTVHDVLPHDQHTSWNWRLNYFAFRAARTWVAHTDKTADRLVAEFGIPRNRLRVVEHGIDRFFAPDEKLGRNWREKYGIASSARLGLFFGKVMRYKGVDVLLNAFEKLSDFPEIEIVIAGKCIDAELHSDLTALIERHPYRARIHWIDGYVSEAEVPGMFQSANFVVLPYRKIDQSGVLFMALSFGLPLVVTTAGSLRNYVLQRAGEVVDVDDVDALASAMGRLASGSNLLPREKILEAAVRYTWEKTLREFCDVYQD